MPDSFADVTGLSGPDEIYDLCKMKAEQLGYKLFGATDKNCLSGDDAENTYNTYGGSKRCVFSKGTAHANGRDIDDNMFVYRLK